MDSQTQSTNSSYSSGSAPKVSIDFNAIMTRAKEVLTNPTGVWTKIKEEQTTIADIYKNYLFVLCAIPVICNFIISARFAFWNSLIGGVALYGLRLGACYVSAMILQWLAPKFEGSTDLLSTFKLVAYAGTASMIGGVVALVPVTFLAMILGIAIGLYSLYTMIQGIPTMTGVPEAKKYPYFVVSVLVGAVVWVVVFFALAAVAPGIFTMGYRSSSQVQLQQNLEEFQNKMDQIQKMLPKGN